jgi:hypothetical protein
MLTSALQKNTPSQSEQKALRPSHSGELRMVDGQPAFPAAERETDTIVALRPQTTLHVAARRRAEIGMKSLLAVAMILASTALSAGQSAAQTNAVTPSGMGSTSPVGTGPGGFAADPQSATLPYSGIVNPAPCSTGNLGTAALPTFDGGGISLDGGGISLDGGGISLSMNSAISELPGAYLPGAYGVGASPSAPCNSVSSSGIMTSPSSLTTSTSGNASSPSSSSSSSGSSPTAANASPDAAGVGVAGLGTSGLGTTGLGSLPAMSGSTSQAIAPSTGVAGSSTFCSGASSHSTIKSTNSNAPTSTTFASATLSADGDASVVGGDASGIVSDPARGVGSGLFDPAQTLAGEAVLPATSAAGAPCMTGE